MRTIASLPLLDEKQRLIFNREFYYVRGWTAGMVLVASGSGSDVASRVFKRLPGHMEFNSKKSVLR